MANYNGYTSAEKTTPSAEKTLISFPTATSYLMDMKKVRICNFSK